MQNPYDDLFDENGKEKKQANKAKLPDPKLEKEDPFVTDNKEPLDEIAENIQLFKENATSFAQLLSNTNASDNKVSNAFKRLFFEAKPNPENPTLFAERQYHQILKDKFTSIIVPMRALAEIHLAIVKQFNGDIDDNYFSVEKTDHNVSKEKSMVIHNINIQRKILGDAASDLIILKDALKKSEVDLKSYINAGGNNNISSAECEIIIQDRLTLTSGQDHQFKYNIFEINMLDKTVISLGLYMQQTSYQYFGKLMKVFDA